MTAEEIEKLADSLWEIGTTDAELDAVTELRRKADAAKEAER